jgi:integrase
MDGESLRALRLLESGLVELPPLGKEDKDAAVSMRQYLERREVWQSLKSEIAAKGEKLTVYGLRHGFALRAHERYGLSPRVAAALMRHSLHTHCEHYGKYTDQAIVERAIQDGIDRLAKKLS